MTFFWLVCEKRMGIDEFVLWLCAQVHWKSRRAGWKQKLKKPRDALVDKSFWNKTYIMNCILRTNHANYTIFIECFVWLTNMVEKWPWTWVNFLLNHPVLFRVYWMNEWMNEWIFEPDPRDKLDQFVQGLFWGASRQFYTSYPPPHEL